MKKELNEIIAGLSKQEMNNDKTVILDSIDLLNEELERIKNNIKNQMHICIDEENMDKITELSNLNNLIINFQDELKSFKPTNVTKASETLEISKESKPLFNRIVKIAKEINNDFVLEYKKLWVNFILDGKIILGIKPKQNAFTIFFNVKFTDLKSEKLILKDLTGKGHHCSGNVCADINKNSDFSEIKRLIEETIRIKFKDAEFSKEETNDNLDNLINEIDFDFLKDET